MKMNHAPADDASEARLAVAYEEPVTTIADAPVAPSVPAPAPPVKGSGQTSRAYSEGFRLLALHMQRLLEGSPRRSLLILSASRKEGRSVTAAGLGQALAEFAPPVVIIDADPQGSGLNGLRPAIQDEIWRPGLQGRDEQPDLQVVAPWQRVGAREGFVEKVRAAIVEAMDAGATVIVDGPAATASSAGFYLATEVSGVLYVARTRKLKSEAVHADVRAQLDLLGARLLGVVVNEG